MKNISLLAILLSICSQKGYATENFCHCVNTFEMSTLEKSGTNLSHKVDDYQWETLGTFKDGYLATSMDLCMSALNKEKACLTQGPTKAIAESNTQGNKVSTKSAK